MANEYVSPTGYSDPDNSWKDETLAFDGDTKTPAIGRVNPYSWSNYLELTIDAIYCSKVKFLAGYKGTGGINSIDLDVYYEDAWHNVYEGSFLDRVWVEKSLGAIYYVTKMRFRFFNSGSEGHPAALGEAMFYEAIGVPKVTTNAATGVSGELATLNGNITDTGGATCTVRGFKYKEGIAGGEQDASDSGAFGKGTFHEALTGLDDTKEYYFKAYATNSEGTVYGEWLSFGVSVSAPTVTSGAATSVDHEKATLNGNITATGGQDCTERGFEWKIGAGGDVETLPETGTFGVGAYSLLLENLSANINYYFRAYAKNNAGTSYGDWLNFTTDYTNPTVITHNATEELETQVTGNGEIVSTGGQDCDERGFEYGLSKVATWKKEDTAGGYGVGFFTKTIDNLSANTEYWYRAFAKFYLYIESGSPIDIGSPVIDRDSWYDWGVSFIVKENPANDNGKITSVDVWFKTGVSGAWVATFYKTGSDPDRFTARDRQWIGTIEGGEKKTFEVDLNVQEGDYIGIWFGEAGQIEADDSGGEGLWRRVGDVFTWENEVFSFTAGLSISLDGIGFTPTPYIGYGEWVKFITAAPGLPGAKPSGYKNDVCSDDSGYSFILNRSLTDDGASYESYFVLSTDLSGKKTLHTNKRLLDIFSYFANKGTGAAKIYVKRDTEPDWQYAGEISLAGEEEIIIRHLPSENEDTEGDVDFLAKTFLIKFVFENDFEFIGMITEAVPIGDR